MVRAGQFLDRMQQGPTHYKLIDASESNYRATAAALLCRLQYHWNLSHPGIEAGVGLLTEQTHFDDPQAAFFSAQFLKRFDANPRARPALINSQIKNGPEAGSWIAFDPNVAAGERIYCTALRTLTLEVGYRHLPLFQDGSPSSAEPGILCAPVRGPKARRVLRL